MSIRDVTELGVWAGVSGAFVPPRLYGPTAAFVRNRKALFRRRVSWLQSATHNDSTQLT